MKRVSLGLVCALLILSGSIRAQAPRQDGRWEIKATMEMAGVPLQLDPITTNECISPEEAKDPQKFLPKGDNAGRCTVSDYKAAGNKTTYSLKCETPPMAGSGEMIYSLDGYTGTLKMEMSGQSIVVRYAARRLGDCTK